MLLLRTVFQVFSGHILGFQGSSPCMRPPQAGRNQESLSSKVISKQNETVILTGWWWHANAGYSRKQSFGPPASVLKRR